MNNDMNPETMNQNPAPEQNTAPQEPQTPPVQPTPNPYAGQQNYGAYNQYQQPNQGQYQQNTNYYQQPNYVDESGLFSETKMARINGTSATMKLGDWLKLDCLSFLTLIPCVGSIAYIVIYCILAFSSKTNKSLKARYQASLIWAAVGLALYLVLIIAVVAMGASFGNLMQEIVGELSY